MIFCFNLVLFTKNIYNSVSRTIADDIVLTGGHSDLWGNKRERKRFYMCTKVY